MIGLFRATGIATKLAKALVGRKGDAAEKALRRELAEIREGLSAEERAEVGRLIHVAAEELG